MMDTNSRVAAARESARSHDEASRLLREWVANIEGGGDGGLLLEAAVDARLAGAGPLYQALTGREETDPLRRDLIKLAEVLPTRATAPACDCCGGAERIGVDIPCPVCADLGTDPAAQDDEGHGCRRCGGAGTVEG